MLASGYRSPSGLQMPLYWRGLMHGETLAAKLPPAMVKRHCRRKKRGLVIVNRRQSLWLGGATVVALALATVGAHAFLPAHPAQAASSTQSSYSKPTWWAKYQTVSASSATPKGGTTNSVTIGKNVDASNEPGPQSETAIAINPSNPSQIVGGSNEIDRLPMRGYTSSDDGASWTGIDLPLPPPLVNNGTDFGSDPGVAWDTHGNVYYSYIVVFFSNGGGVAINGTEMAVARSTDGGHTWTSSYFATQTGEAQFNDKPMIAVDDNPNSPYRDTIYVAWDNAGGKASSSNLLLVSHSSDGGKTFSTPVAASSTQSGPKQVIGADPFVGPTGDLHVAWHDVQNNAIVESDSTDGGQTFGATHTIAPTQVAFDVSIPAQNTRNALVYPACGADDSAGSHRGTLYCSWMDETATNGTDIFVARSTDGGATWSSGVRVNDDPTGVANDQFNQWLSVDPTDGSVNVSWNDTRNDPTHVSTDIFYARSVTGAVSFGANAQVTTASTNETTSGADLGNQYGDYEGIAAYNGSIHPIWTDRRASVVNLGEEVFTATITAK